MKEGGRPLKGLLWDLLDRQKGVRGFSGGLITVLVGLGDADKIVAKYEGDEKKSRRVAGVIQRFGDGVKFKCARID